MRKVSSIALLLVFLFLLNACARKQYVLKSANGCLVEMNSRFDNRANPEMLFLVQTYKAKLDSKMNEVIGETVQSLTNSGVQSLLANFTADAMQEYAGGLWGPVDFAVINRGGIRTTLNQGAVTISNLYEIYVFENRLVLLELPGSAVKQLFAGFAKRTMEGFSKSIQLKVKNNTIESLTIGGKPLDEKATYRIVTVDYLAEGNDGMEVLTKATQYTDSNIILRNAMIEYIKKLTAEDKKIYAIPDDRIEIKE